MSITTPLIKTLADLLDQLGNVDPKRIRFHPAPGTATVQDVLDVQTREHRLCELVEQVLVEKAVGFQESWLASCLIYALLSFVKPRDLGIVTGEAGLVQLAPGLVRIPDVAFIAWDRLPGRRLPTAAIPDIVPNLVVEVLSASNTSRELDRKRRDYFGTGVELIWLVDPRTRSVDVYTALDHVTRLSASETLGGDPVLPGFTLSLQELFQELDREED